MRYQIFTILLLFLPLGVQAQKNSKDFKINYTFEDQWTVFDEDRRSFVPYIAEIHDDYQQLHLYLEYKNYRGLDLYLQGSKSDFLFVNNRLVYSFSTDTLWRMSVDSLFAKGAISNLLLTYTSPKRIEKIPKILITNVFDKTTSPLTTLSSSQKLIAFLRPLHEVREFLFLVSLGLLGIMALLSYQNKSENGIFFVTKYLNGFNRVSDQIKRTPFFNSLSYIVFYVLSCSFSLYFLSHYSSLLSVPSWLKGDSAFSEYSNIFALVGILMLGQYLLIALFSTLYSDKTLSSAHYHESMQAGQLICVVSAVSMMLLNTVVSYLGKEQMNLLVYLFFLILIVKAALVSYRLNKLIPYQNIYLFSYLCATEYVPLLIPTKIFVKF